MDVRVCVCVVCMCVCDTIQCYTDGGKMEGTSRLAVLFCCVMLCYQTTSQAYLRALRETTCTVQTTGLRMDHPTVWPFPFSCHLLYIALFINCRIGKSRVVRYLLFVRRGKPSSLLSSTSPVALERR